MLKPSEKTFTETVDDIGQFSFKYPNLMDELEIDATCAKLLSGNENPSIHANNIAYMMASLKVATEKAPEGWNLEDIYKYGELEAVYNAYASQVFSFRGEDIRTDQSPGSENGQDAGVLVSSEI